MKKTFFIGLGFFIVFLFFFVLGSIQWPIFQSIKTTTTYHFFEENSQGPKEIKPDLFLDSSKTDSVLPERNRVEGAKEIIKSFENFDSTGERVLLIGDSQCEGLKNVLSKYCEKNRHKLVGTVIYYSSTTKQFGTNSRLEEYLKEFKPTVVFFVIGLNEIFAKDLVNRAKYIQRIKEILQNSQTKFAWVGPAAWTKDRGIIDLMQKSVGSNFFPSHHLILERSNDKRHPSKSASKIWFDLIAKWADSTGIIKFPIKVDSVSNRCMGKVILLNALNDK